MGIVKEYILELEKHMMITTTSCGGSENFVKEVKMMMTVREWKDIPVELLMQILSLLDDQMVITASHVCHGWRDSISFALTRLSLSWYILYHHTYVPVFSFFYCFLS